MRLQYGIVVGLCVALVLGGLFFLFYAPQPTKSSPQSMGQSKFEGLADYVPVTARVPPPQYRHYWSDDFAFSLFYPEDMVIDEHPERNGGMTAVFYNKDTDEGFQVYVAPYFADTITEEQFKRDVPSGVRKNEKRGTIHRTESVEFESEDEVLGPTFEVWVIKYGYLYEITAPLDQRGLVEQVVKDWRFY